jgi:hypothetical protein
MKSIEFDVPEVVGGARIGLALGASKVFTVLLCSSMHSEKATTIGRFARAHAPIGVNCGSKGSYEADAKTKVSDRNKDSGWDC